MSIQIQKPNDKIYDLEERTSKFGEDLIDFLKIIPRNPINDKLIGQVIRSGTSIGANYMEADCAVSKKDFKNKISISRKEAKETCHWMRMIAKANPSEIEKCRFFWKEAHEFVLIFSKIINSSNNE